MSNAIVIGLILILIILFIGWYMVRSDACCEHNVTALAQYASKPLNCRDPQILKDSTDWYNNLSQYNGVFIIDPLSTVQSGDSTCDIKYWYAPVPGAARTDFGMDWRRFIYAPANTPTGWTTIGMGDWKSGVLNA